MHLANLEGVNTYAFYTEIMHLSARQIADIYKECRQEEECFSNGLKAACGERAFRASLKMQYQFRYSSPHLVDFCWLFRDFNPSVFLI